MKYRYPSNLRLGVACLSLLLCTFSLRAAETVLVPAEADWRYLSGSEEASSPDPGAWRLPGFDDTGWTAAAAAIGYGEPFVVTDLSELDPPMRRNYTGIFLRKSFEVVSLASLESYTFSSLYDDGFIAWINGVEVLRVNMPGEAGDPISI